MGDADLAIFDEVPVMDVAIECASAFLVLADALDCLSTETGLSDGCLECYGDLLGCAMGSCPVCAPEPLGKGAKSLECQLCLAQKCTAAFIDCSGMDPGGT